MIDDISLFFYSLQHFHFLRPYWLLALIAIVYIIRTFSLRDDTIAQWRTLMSPDVLSHLTVEGNSNHWLSPQKMSIILGIPLCIVLMGPTWTQQPSPFSENNAPLVIALDVSTTMEQSDVQPSRLLRAKQKIIELLEVRGDSKTALIAFAGSAHVVMPLSNDREMIRHFLDALDNKVMPVSGKLPESIIPLSSSILATSEVPGTLLLIGDGATSNTVAAFKNYFDEQAAQLIVWGIGKDKDLDSAQSTGNIIPLQLEQLTALSEESNGRLVRMSNDNTDVNRVNNYIKHNLIIVDDTSRPWHDSGYPMVFLVGAIFLFWFRKGWTLQW